MNKQEISKIEGFRIVPKADEPKRSLITLDGLKMMTEQEALGEFRKKLRLPYGMGVNYDSLEEVLRPDFWPERRELHIRILNAEYFLGDGNPEVARILCGILKDTVKTWHAEKGKPDSFIVEFQMDE